MARELVIGDDFPFTARDVTWERDGEPVPSAELSWTLRDEAGVTVVSGDMAQYDAIAASYEAVIPRASLGLYHVVDNPTGIRPGRRYFVDVGIEDGGVLSTVSLEVLAVTRRTR